jgi:hypothetical protein
MPTKALLRSASALRAARRLPGAREAVTGDLNAAAVLRRRDSFASNWSDDGQVSWLDSAGIALHRGRGRISSDRVVEVRTGEDGPTVSLTARHAVVVATGSSALIPDVPGIREAAPWTSREAAAASEGSRSARRHRWGRGGRGAGDRVRQPLIRGDGAGPRWCPAAGGAVRRRAGRGRRTPGRYRPYAEHAGHRPRQDRPETRRLAHGACGDDRRGRRGAAGSVVARGPAFPTVSEVWLRLLEAYGR